eukprot:gene2048-2086_t
MKIIRLALLAALALAPVQSARAADPIKVTMAGAPGGLPHWLPVYVARARFFAEEGLAIDWVPLRSGSAEVAAVMGGSAQVAPVGIELPVLSYENGGDLVLICDLFNVQPYSIVLSNDAIAKTGVQPGMKADEILQRMKGLKIAITGPGSATDNFIRHAFQFRGIDPDAHLSLQPLGDPAAMLAAIQRKLIDGFVMSAPADQIVQQRGFGRPVLDAFSGALPELAGVPFAGLVTSRTQMKARPELFAAILRAMTKAIRLLQENPEEAKVLVRPYFADMDAETFETVMRKYVPGAAKSPVHRRGQAG